MSFFKKLFTASKQKEVEKLSVKKQDASLDQIFVQNFIQKNGKFLYCTNLEEVTFNLSNIIQENAWETIICNDSDLLKLIKVVTVKTTQKFNSTLPVFVGCEHLIAENGSILFSSNQLNEFKIASLNKNFIVYATTSQIVKSKNESLTGIKTRYPNNIPSNISAIKNYNPNTKDIDFMNYGNTNTKNLYLLLFEDL